MADEWNLNTPTDDELVPDLPGEHRERKTNVAAVLEKEHATLGDGNSGGEHSQGSAVAWYLATGSIPALDLEGNALAATDNGRLWLDSTTKIFYALDDYSNPTVGNGWVAFGHLLGDIAINTNKFTVARATGNTLVAGTLDVTGNIDPTSFETTNGGFLDEDDMTSDDATVVASQQSIKAYLNGGAPVIVDSDSSALDKDHAYRTQCPGFVTAYVTNTNQYIRGYVGTTADPQGGGTMVAQSGGADATDDPFICFYVGYEATTGIFFEIRCGTSLTEMTWTPLVNGGGAPIDQD